VPTVLFDPETKYAIDDIYSLMSDVEILRTVKPALIIT